MGVLIDSSILIGYERGRVDVASRVSGREREEFFLSVITASELLHGVWRASDTTVRSKRQAFVEGVLNQFPLLPIDLETARVHAQLWADLEARGAMIGLHDSWLAASCLAHDLKIATHNIREFKQVRGLRVERW